MHDNRRYVKLTWISLLGLLSLACAGGAQAELVTLRADRGVLAVASDGTPYVAYAVGRNLHLAVRQKNSGTWRSTRLGRLPGANVTLAGIRVSDRPHRFVSVLAEDTGGRWITLARGSRVTAVARAAAGSRFGSAGLTLDAQQRPAIAYAVRRPSADTFLRLVTFDRAGRSRVRGITEGGFPASSTPPGAAPVLVRGRLHVVQTYASAVIDWGPKTGGGWEGQFLYASRAGFPAGPVGAVFIASTLFTVWAQVYPGEPEDVSVQLNSSGQTQETWTLTHGSYVSVVDGGGVPETGAVDWVDLGDWREYATVIILGTNSGEWQLDGRLEGYGVGQRGSRQALLSRDRGLEWFQSPGSAGFGIQIWMGVDATGKVTGSVVGQTGGGVVEIYREVPHAPRELVVSAPIAADSSFAAQVPPPSPGTVYRGVYIDPNTSFPFGALAGISAGVTG
jgi:hypothetical protein